MITLDNLTYSYRKNVTNALGGVTASIEPGMYLLLGENGAGKTTLLKIIDGLLRPQSGSCLIDGDPAADRQPSTMAKIFFLADNMTFPADTINTMARIHAPFYPTFSTERLAANLAMFGMTGNEKLLDLSLGNRHKAQVAYALALGTPVLLMDEPTNGLDITSKQAMAQMLAQCIGPEQTVIISTHNVDNFQNLYDGVIMLSHSRLLLAMPTWEITRRISFRASMTQPEQPLYLERHMGLFRSIEPNAEASDETDIDYTMLYNALMSPDCDKILQQLHTSPVNPDTQL